MIHKANWASELQGCIAFGEKLGSAKKRKSDWKDPRWMVTNSGKTTKSLLEFIKENGITHVEIQDVSNEVIDEELYNGLD